MKLSVRSALFASMVSVAVAGLGCGKSDNAQQQYFDAGNAHFAERKFAEAILDYRNALKADPKFGPARLKLADAYLETGNVSNAQKEYERAADLLPNELDAQLKAARVLLIAGRFDDAKVRAEKAAALQPQHAEAQILLGSALAGLRDLEGSVRQIEEAIALDPKRGQSYSNLGIVQLSQGKKDEARAAFEKAVEIEPASVGAQTALAKFYLTVGEAEGAERTLKRILSLAPDNRSAARALATFYITNNRPQDAELPLKALAAKPGTPADRLALADYYLQQSRNADATVILQNLSGTNVAAAAQVRLAQIAYSNKRNTEAHSLVDQVLSREPKHVEALIAKGHWLVEEGKITDGIRLLNAAVAADPASARAQYELGLAHAAAADFEAAQGAFRAVLTRNPRATAAQLALSQIELAKGDATGSLQLARAAVKAQPSDLTARIVEARALLAAKALKEADAAIANLLASHPGVAEVQALAGHLASAKGDRDEARARFQAALRLDKNSSGATAGLVALDLASRNMNEASARAQTAVVERPTDPDTLMLSARTAMARGEFAQAEEPLRRLVELQPSNVGAHNLLGHAYLQQKKLDEALRHFEEVVKLQPKSVQTHTTIAMILQSQGKGAEARTRYEHILSLDSSSPTAANNLAWMIADSGGDLDQALRLAESARRRMPREPQFSDTVGWIYYKKSLPALAIPHFERSVGIDPKNPIFHYHLGLAHAEAGEGDKAKRSLEQALALTPSFDGADEARQTLSRLK